MTVSPERLPGWIDTFRVRHGGGTAQLETESVTLIAPDGARARLIPPVAGLGSESTGKAAGLDPVGTDAVAALIAHLRQPRHLGALLVRRGGWAVGVFHGPDLAVSRVGRGYVQGQTKAGGWSQQRYARRRARQADQLYTAAADAAAILLLPRTQELSALYGGGDAFGVHTVLSDHRLTPLAGLLVPAVLPTPDPRLRVLQEFGPRVRAVRIELNGLA